MALEDLNFKINAPVQDAMANIKKLASQLNDVMKTTDQIDANFRAMGESLGLPAKQVELLLLRIQPLVNNLAKADKQAHALEESFTRKLMQKALEEHHRKVIQLADGTQRARYEMIRLADASTTLRIPSPSGRSAPAQQSGGVNFVRVASAVGQLTLMQKANATLRSMRTSIGGVHHSVAAAAKPLDRFRMGLAAPKVDPSLNVAKNVVTKVGEAASGAVNKLRGMADATITGIPDTLQETAKQAGALNVELDKTSATMSKHVSKMQTTSKGLTLLSKVFPFASGAIAKIQGPLDAATAKAEKMANAVDKGNAKVAAGANTARNAAYIMTGSFQSMGGSADLFARAQFHAMLPLRLMKREIDGANRVVRAGIHVWNFATAPVHKLSLTIGQSRAAFQNFRATLPPLTGGLQLGTRAIRAFAHGTYLTSSAIRPLVALVKGTGTVTAKAASGLMSMARGARSMAGSVASATGIQNTFIGRAIGMKQSADAAATSMAKLGNTSGSMGGMLSGISGKAILAAGAIMALVTGAMAWGASTAVAGEKNDVVFGTMLKDMNQGKALVDSLQATDAAKLFDNDELLTSGRLLFKAGVSAADLGAKTNQLATIAVATSSDLNDLSRIYQQGAVTGSFGQDKINQLAERGIDIYHGLEAATGKSGGELKKMISDGKIGLTEMDAALAHLTDGNGIYAGALQNVAGTAGGMLGQMKNNTQQALGQLMGYGLNVFKPILAAGVMFTDKLKSAVIALEPVFVLTMGLVTGVMSSAWTAITEIATGAFSLIFGDSQVTFDSIIVWMASMMGAATFIFANLGTIANYAWTTLKLGAVMAFNDIVYFFTDTIPAYLNWFSENWASVFLDAGTVIATVFSNIAKNIGSAMKAIWSYIKSGGTADLQFAFVPLLDGFKATVAELPNVPERALTQLEQKLTGELGSMGADLGGGLQKAMADAVASVGTQEKSKLSDKGSATQTGTETASDKASRKAAENNAIHARSSEGQGLIAQMSKAFSKGDTEKKAHNAMIEQQKDIRKIARSVEKGKPLVAGGAW
jgi:tape measure domain-containing protein